VTVSCLAVAAVCGVWLADLAAKRARYDRVQIAGEHDLHYRRYQPARWRSPMPAAGRSARERGTFESFDDYARRVTPNGRRRRSRAHQ